MDPIQFEIIHEENKDQLGILDCVHEFYMGEKEKHRDACIKLYATYARRTCPISYLSVTSDKLSYVRPSRRARHPNGMTAFT